MILSRKVRLYPTRSQQDYFESCSDSCRMLYNAALEQRIWAYRLGRPVNYYDQQKEIFGVEGAVPVFKKEAFESLRINNEIFDHDFFWYAEDFDIAWRMNMFGWKQIFVPDAIAWHDRKTTKSLSGGFSEFCNIRRQIPIAKRRLEFRNIRWAIIKNDYAINILKDMVYIVRRELLMLAYLFLFEPKVLIEIPMMLGKLPKILKKRKQVMRLAKTSPERIRTWFN
ncbi:MAG: Glycosyl transferase family 2 [Parcubacteria group bacterium GW2011_GWC1_39_29]|nr:MAG: Glycosyl transferase family 2 [Parcubacteria group bacterium GW2011_GWC1_39_29]